jgi:hypothetical protein
MRKIVASSVVAAVAGVCAAWPAASIVSVKQSASGSGALEVAYTLSGGPAVVLFDVQTNGPAGWVSIGGENISGNGYGPEGAVNRYVSGEGPHTLTWHPDMAWRGGTKIDGDNARVCLDVYAPCDTPDYMVVELLVTNDVGSVKYYKDVESLPGGILSNHAYRTSKLVMRRIRAKGVTWSMGATRPLHSGDTVEAGTLDYLAHEVTLTNDYYIGVFEMTVGQLYCLRSSPYPEQPYTEPAVHTNYLMYPLSDLSYCRIREDYDNTAPVPEHMYPNPPAAYSLLGFMRAATVSERFPQGFDFDLPSEAQWEYAARAGAGPEKWNTGGPISDTTAVPGCWNASCPVPVGSFEPNAWGLYDTLGNVWELCLDWQVADIRSLGGAVNANGKYLVSSPETLGEKRMIRGGGFNARYVRYLYPARRGSNSRDPKDSGEHTGFRVVCRAGL